MTATEPVTEKEAAFIIALVIDGMGPADAYRASRDTSRMKNSSIHANAKHILRRPRVKAWIAEIRAEQEASESPIQIQSPTRARVRARESPR